MQDMRNSLDSISEIKNISGRRSIRNEEQLKNRKIVNNNEDRSISEPPQSYSMYKTSFIDASSTTTTSNINRLKPIREKNNGEEHQGSSDDDDDDEVDDDDLSKSNSQLNESDLDLELPDSVSQTPTPTPLGSGTGGRRINSETNLNDSKKRMSGFMGNRSKRFCASTSELSFSTHLDTRKSLFSPKNNQRSLSRSSLFGSSNSLNSTNSRLFMMNSPFYNGKTMFGGASAYPRRDISNLQQKLLRTPVQMRPSSSLSNSSATSTKSDSVLPESNAAKRILDIMNQFSGPLKEARSMGGNISSKIKLPGLVQNQKRYGEEELNFDHNNIRSTTPYGRPLLTSVKDSSLPFQTIASSLTASNKSLQIPTMSQLLKMKRLQNNTERVREIANRSQSFLNQFQDYKLPSNTKNNDESSLSNSPAITTTTVLSSSSSLKMKNNFTKNLLRNDKGIDQHQLPPAPLNLPNIQLPELKSIPKFDIQIPSPSSSKSLISTSPPSSLIFTQSQSSTIATDKKSSETMNFKTLTSASIKNLNNNIYSFSKPLKLSSNFDIKKLKNVTENFVFTRPLSLKSSSSSLKSPSKIIDVTKVNDDVSSEEEKQKTTKPIVDNLFKNLAAQQKSMWECDDCMTRNDMEKTKCMCCEKARVTADSGISSQGSSIGSIDSMTSPPPLIPVADDLFKKLAAKQKSTQWECDVCMCKNDLNKDKCMSCESSKPGAIEKPSTLFKFGISSSPSTVAMKPADDLFKSLVAQQKKSRWECDDCMTGNDVNSEKCVACEKPRPGSKSISTVSSFSFGMPEVTQKFSFGMPPTSSDDDNSFKKLIEKQNEKWECSVCMVRNDQTQLKCISCVHPKPGTSDSLPKFLFGSVKSTPGVLLPNPSEVKFSFGMHPAKKEEEKKEEEKKVKDKQENKATDEIDNLPKQTFSFGNNNMTVVKEVNVTPSYTFKSPSVNKIVDPVVSASFTIKSPQAEVKDDKKVENAKSPILSTTIENKSEKIAIKEASSVPSFGGFKFGADMSGIKSLEETKEQTSGGFTFKTSANMNLSSTETFSFSSPKSTALDVIKPTFGTFSSPSTTTAVTTTNNKLPGSFAFGSPTPVTTFTFGSDTNKEGVAAPKSGFPLGSTENPVFGIQQTNSSTFTFGSSPKVNNEIKSTFSSFASSQVTATTASSSPSLLANTSTPVFGQASTASAPSSVFSFGSKPSIAPSSTQQQQPAMIFGSSNAASSTPNLTPIFGSNAKPTFGSNIAANNNNESEFGSKMMSFGNNAPQKRAFDFGSALSDVPQKKFEFGSHVTQQQQPQTNSTPFQFNAQNQMQQQPTNLDTARPAFNFNATAPSFNFTSGSNVINNNSQENSTFQFGVNNASSTFSSSSTPQGIFAFGANVQPQHAQSAPIMQFGATGAPSITIPGINSFGPSQTNATANANRKILRAARRTNVQRR